MATILLDDTTTGRTYVAKFTADSDGTVWRPATSTWVAASTLANADLATAVNAVTTTEVQSSAGTCVGYKLTVPAGITVPCHVSLYLTSYAAGDAEDYGYDYDPQVGQILEDTGTTLPGTLTTIAGYIDTEVASILAAVDTEVAALIATVGVAGAGLTAVPWNSSWDAEVQSECTDAINAIDIDGKALPAAIKYQSAVLAGKISGAGTGTEKAYGLDGTTERVRFTVDEDGNRTAVSYDP